MTILIYILTLPVYFGMKIIAQILSPVTSLFVSPYGRLPRFLAWFETPDSNMFGAFGDVGFYLKYNDKTGTFWGRWWTCLCWQWRNTSQGFATYVLGLDEANLNIVETVYPSEFECYKKVARNSSGSLVGFEYKGSVRYGKTSRRFRWRIGWKFGWEEGQKAQYVFAINPWMKC